MKPREVTMRIETKAMKWMGLLIGILVVGGCGAIPSLKSDRNVRNINEIPQEISMPVKELPSDGSLWRGNGQRNLFRDLRARDVGDLVTVNISESSKASKKANTKTSRESSIEAGINNAMGWETKIKEVAS